MDDAGRLLVALALAGIVAGLALLARGLAAYRAAQRVAGIGTSRVATLAAGELRLVGVVEADVMTLVSPLQSVPCVYFRSRIREGSGDDARTIFDAASDWSGDDPPGLAVNPGASHRPAGEDREAQIAALLTVRPAADLPGDGTDGAPSLFSASLRAGGFGSAGPRRRDYEERRLAPGDTITIVGSALPFGDLDDPATADRFDPTLALDDPEVAMNLAEARAAGVLADTPEEAWGNAAIPGFGIGRPVRAPELDPDAALPALAGPDEAAAAEVRFEIAPGELVVAAAPDHPLAILAGTPGEAGAREDGKVLLGLAGAALAIASAVVLALALPGSTR